MTEYNKNNPFPAKIEARTLLNQKGSTKNTYHLTLSLAGSNIQYQPGDALGIFPENPTSVVNTILKALNKSGSEEIVDPRSQATLTFKQFLLTKANLLRITLPMLKQFKELSHLTHDEAKKERLTLIENHDVEDLFLKCAAPDAPLQELVSYFSPLLPRFYSIASSQCLDPNFVDLLIVTFSCKKGDKIRQGLGSQFLCEFAKPLETPIPTYLHPNATFKLPEDPTLPIIMIGPGTGVAPYRAFLQQRLETDAKGKNWLFFGERQRAYDFYYESFFTDLAKRDFLRLDCAFSRDQESKVYVQDLLQKEGVDIWKWIQDGAMIYVCGDAHRMAKDVTATLHDIAAKEGNLSDQDAKNFIRQLRKDKRLLLDVY